MITFPSELNVELKQGINIIFGGNHSGKTTLVNSIKYSLFGLSWDRNQDGLEGRYFSNRINEAKKKSLEITSTFNIKSKAVLVKRIIYTSGKVDLKATLSSGMNESISHSGESITSEENYKSKLRENMGLIFEEQIKFVPDLLIADENRLPVLWKDDLESIISSFLISNKSTNKIRLLDHQFSKTKTELERIEQKNVQLLHRRSNNSQIIGTLKNKESNLEKTSKKEVDLSDQEIEKEFEDAKTELTFLDKSIDGLNMEMQSELLRRSKMQGEINSDQGKMLRLRQDQQALNTELMKVFLNPEDPRSTHLGRAFYYDKTCPFCSSDISVEVQYRLDQRKCPICGIGNLSAIRIDNADAVNEKLTKIEHENEELIKIVTSYQESIADCNKNIEKISLDLVNCRNKRETIFRKINTLAGFEEILHHKKVLREELEDWEKKMEMIDNEIETNQIQIKSIKYELERINDLKIKTKDEIKTETSKQVLKIKEAFSEFTNEATNGELSCHFNIDFLPVLNGRTVFYPEQCSQFERTTMDIGFRVAFLSVFAELTNTTPTVILETPDEVTDEAYIPYFYEALIKFSANLSMVITTVRLNSLEKLLEKNKGNLINLLSKGTLTQRKYYALPLQAFISGSL